MRNDRFPQGAAAVAARAPVLVVAARGLLEGRRVPEHEPLGAARGTVVGDECHLAACDVLGVFARVGDRGRAADELRRGTVVAADPVEAPDHVGEVGSEDAAVRVDFVDDHVAQVGEEPVPAGVVGQNPLVEHIGVRQHEIAAVAQSATEILGRVPVVGSGEERLVPGGGLEPAEGAQLILCERLGRVEVEGAGERIPEDRFDDRHVVAERLAGGGAGDDDDAAAGSDMFDCLGLVRVETLNAARLESGAHGGRQALRQFGVGGRPLVQGLDVKHLVLEGVPVRNAAQEGLYVHGGAL